ncbi:putative 115 kDa protein in type-1 retrotransposable element R1DM [Blattella germanica]|nr:putative 115 kDa protein in type-1 retrotransposable element R1DM [Blattella germanica]
MDIPIENSLEKIEVILQFANGAKQIIAVDTNSRSKPWHDFISNSRGRILEEFLASNQFQLVNQESEIFTFENSRGSSNIDLTITNT